MVIQEPGIVGSHIIGERGNATLGMRKPDMCFKKTPANGEGEDGGAPVIEK